MKNYREILKNKQRIVVKIGSSSLQHAKTGDLDYAKMDILVRELCNIRNQGKDVILVTSGAIAVGKKATRGKEQQEHANPIALKQAHAAIGQAMLMMIYEKLFAEYNQLTAQILMTKNTIIDPLNKYNAQNTFSELLALGAIPIVNENDTVATYEIEIGDNDTLSAIVAALTGADLLILLSDIDGLYSDDPREHPDAKFIDLVETLDETYMNMGKSSTGSSVGTGGMNTKMVAAQIATKSDIDMIIANSKNVKELHQILEGSPIGTLFVANKDEAFDLVDFVNDIHKEK